MNYNIEGEPLPVVICNLEANETNDYRKRCHVMDDSKHEDGDYIKWRHRQNVWPCIFR